MSGLAKLDEKIAAMEAALEQIRAATREAHETTKSLRLVEKEIRDLLARDARAIFDEAIGEIVRAGLKSYSEEIKRAQSAAVDRVTATFDELAAILTGTEKGDTRPSLRDLIEQRAAREGNGS